jgi:hypothetical protein
MSPTSRHDPSSPARYSRSIAWAQVLVGGVVLAGLVLLSLWFYVVSRLDAVVAAPPPTQASLENQLWFASSEVVGLDAIPTEHLPPLENWFEKDRHRIVRYRRLGASVYAVLEGDTVLTVIAAKQ